MKLAYFSVLMVGVVLVLVGILLVIVRPGTTRPNGDRFYMTTSQERLEIRQRTESGPVAEKVSTARQNSSERVAADFARSVDVVTVSAVGVTRTVSRPSETIDVSVAGSKNTVTIVSGTHVNLLTISGSSHSVTLEAAATVGSISVSGSDNVITVPAGADVEIRDGGVGTRLVNADP